MLVTWKLIRVGKFALIVPVITSTDGRCVAMIRWMPAARAICARRWIAPSMSLPATIIRSAISSTTITMYGSGARSIASSTNTASPVWRSKPVWIVRVMVSPRSRASFMRAL
ncbi:hypothetical protein FOHLNKBM_6366 [Methylobacterium longum]|nr:hypothetical protein FOHLNKBM_6366 [Methylobacterium longum]